MTRHCWKEILLDAQSSFAMSKYFCIIKAEFAVACHILVVKSSGRTCSNSSWLLYYTSATALTQE